MAQPQPNYWTDPASGRRYTVDPVTGQSRWLDDPTVAAAPTSWHPDAYPTPGHTSARPRTGSHVVRNVALAGAGVLVVVLVVAVAVAVARQNTKGAVNAVAGGPASAGPSPTCLQLNGQCIDTDVPTDTSTPSDPPSEDQGGTRPAIVGDKLTLTGNDPGEQLDVTVLKVASTTTATDGFSRPDPGNRYVAVRFQLVNTGTTTYDDAPSNGAKVGDRDGEQFDSTLVEGIKAGPLLPSSVKLGPGGKAVGWMVFEIPKASKLAMVQFSMNSGFGQTGEWKL